MTVDAPASVEPVKSSAGLTRYLRLGGTLPRFIARRVFETFATLLILSVAIFLLSRLSGNPVNLLLPIWATPEQIADLERALGLDRSLPEQYLSFLTGILRGDFGSSVATGEPALELFFSYLPNTVALTILALLWAILLGIPLGVLAAVRSGTWIDRAVRWISAVGLAMPMFWLAILLMQVFSVWLGIAPVSGAGSLAQIVLPSVSLGAYFVAGLARLVRTSVLEVLSAEHVLVLRATGISEAKLLSKHISRNAAVAPLTFLGQYGALLLGGAVVVELIFAYPGVGWLAYNGIISRDYPIIQVVVLLNGALILLASLAIDLICATVDPRMRL